MHAVTNIQKFSIHDGDGIRTTVFFKGCPLRCVWCHNPETQAYPPQLQFDRAKCTGCGFCVRVCPNQAVTVDPMTGKSVTDPSKCDLCGRCAKACPVSAREVIGREYTVRELVREVMKDEMFYEESGGGVTLSGGEVMTIDPDYLLALVKELHRQGLNVTIDTCGYVPYERFSAILPYVDTFLYDIKAMDPAVHEQYMGVDNRLILENLIRLSRDGARIYIRIPTVKEVNGTREHMQAVIDFLKANEIRVAQVNLLPYHDTGSGKYPRLGLEYGGADLHAPDREEMQGFVELFKSQGFTNTKIGG